MISVGLVKVAIRNHDNEFIGPVLGLVDRRARHEFRNNILFVIRQVIVQQREFNSPFQVLDVFGKRDHAGRPRQQHIGSFGKHAEGQQLGGFVTIQEDEVCRHFVVLVWKSVRKA